MIDWAVDRPGMRLGCGDSVNYDGDADLVFSHLYGPLPKQLVGKPAIINVFGDRKAQAEAWCGAELHIVSTWGKGLTNTIYAANLPVLYMDMRFLVEDEFEPGRGWFPEDLCWCLLDLLLKRRYETIFDGFMGRGTVGKVARATGANFVGVDINPQRVAIAREYLGC